MHDETEDSGFQKKPGAGSGLCGRGDHLYPLLSSRFSTIQRRSVTCSKRVHGDCGGGQPGLGDGLVAAVQYVPAELVVMAGHAGLVGELAPASGGAHWRARSSN